MSIPERQLKTWSKQGAVATAKKTRKSLYNALHSRNSSIPDDKDYEIYLQGSYRNSTNIYGDSDVDVVVQLNSTWRRDLSRLSTTEKSRYISAYFKATYSWDGFRKDVLDTLRDYYGSDAVTEGSKCLKVDGKSGRLPADVAVCLQYRKYESFTNRDNQSYVPGIVFHSLPDRREIVNYPKPHYENGAEMNQRGTNEWYKPTVRMFKNARNCLIENGAIGEDAAPSYFLECLLYNVPNSKFGGSYQETYCDVVDWLAQRDLHNFICQNEQLPLFGNTPEQWSTNQARHLVNELIKLWTNWN